MSHAIGVCGSRRNIPARPGSHRAERPDVVAGERAAVQLRGSAGVLPAGPTRWYMRRQDVTPAIAHAAPPCAPLAGSISPAQALRAHRRRATLQHRRPRRPVFCFQRRLPRHNRIGRQAPCRRRSAQPGLILQCARVCPSSSIQPVHEEFQCAECRTNLTGEPQRVLTTAAAALSVEGRQRVERVLKAGHDLRKLRGDRKRHLSCVNSAVAA
jgi:hypothetical protein